MTEFSLSSGHFHSLRSIFYFSYFTLNCIHHVPYATNDFFSEKNMSDGHFILMHSLKAYVS